MPIYDNYTALDFASDESFIRYYEGSKQSDIDFWETWIAKHSTKKQEIDEAHMLLDTLRIHLPREEQLKERKRFEQWLYKEVDSPHERPGKSRKRSWGLYAAAAILLLLLSVGVILYQNIPYETSTEETPWLSYSTPAQKQAKLNLPDGTFVRLAASSTLHYPSAFKQHRTVKLDGKALFDVKTFKENPFIIETDALNIQVLGTSFSMEAYEEDNTCQVNLLTGKILISTRNGEQHVLRPGQTFLFDKMDNKAEILRADLKQATAWTKGTMVFHQANLQQIARTLQREYGYIIETKGGTRIRFNGQIDRLTLPEVLDILSSTLNIHYQLNGEHVYIQAKP